MESPVAAFLNGDAAISFVASGAYGSPRSAPVKILLVDDYAPFAQSLKVMLDPPHEVTIASKGAEAISKLSEQPFDTAFVDLKLPDMSGVDVCRAIVDRGVHLPRGVVLITGGGADATLWAELTRLKVKFISKPFTADQLFALLQPA